MSVFTLQKCSSIDQRICCLSDESLILPLGVVIVEGELLGLDDYHTYHRVRIYSKIESENVDELRTELIHLHAKWIDREMDAFVDVTDAEKNKLNISLRESVPCIAGRTQIRIQAKDLHKAIGGLKLKFQLIARLNNVVSWQDISSDNMTSYLSWELDAIICTIDQLPSICTVCTYDA
jgi:hypothetical protein